MKTYICYPKTSITAKILSIQLIGCKILLIFVVIIVLYSFRPNLQVIRKILKNQNISSLTNIIEKFMTSNRYYYENITNEKLNVIINVIMISYFG